MKGDVIVVGGEWLVALLLRPLGRYVECYRPLMCDDFVVLIRCIEGCYVALRSSTIEPTKRGFSIVCSGM